jgi:hypothetical protein
LEETLSLRIIRYMVLFLVMPKECFGFDFYHKFGRIKYAAFGNAD